jgi:hypothetical protein
MSGVAQGAFATGEDAVLHLRVSFGQRLGAIAHSAQGGILQRLAGAQHFDGLRRGVKQPPLGPPRVSGGEVSCRDQSPLDPLEQGGQSHTDVDDIASHLLDGQDQPLVGLGQQVEPALERILRWFQT